MTGMYINEEQLTILNKKTNEEYNIIPSIIRLTQNIPPFEEDQVKERVKLVALEALEFQEEKSTRNKDSSTPSI